MATKSLKQATKAERITAANAHQTLTDAINAKDLALEHLESILGTLQLVCENARNGDDVTIKADTVNDLSWAAYTPLGTLKIAIRTIVKTATGQQDPAGAST